MASREELDEDDGSFRSSDPRDPDASISWTQIVACVRKNKGVKNGFMELP
jgi:hypothetical protein